MKNIILGASYLMMIAVFCLVISTSTSDMSAFTFFIFYFIISRLLIIPFHITEGKFKISYFLPIIQSYYLFGKNKILYAIHLITNSLWLLQLIGWSVESTNPLKIFAIYLLPTMVFINVVDGLLLIKAIKANGSKFNFIFKLTLFVPCVRMLYISLYPSTARYVYLLNVNKNNKEEKEW